MGKVIGGMTLSLDGFMEDRNGEIGRLYPNFEELRDAEFLQESMKTTGAVIFGRRTYDMGNDDYTGYEYQVPIFVVTHHAPEKAAKGENDKLKFHFVMDGVESAVRQAKAAAGDKDVIVVGGANITQQILKAGLIDELQIGIVPVLFGDGLRFFENLRDTEIKLEKIRLIESPGGRTDIMYRIVK
jgi:dihydrofolate reductase